MWLPRLPSLKNRTRTAGKLACEAPGLRPGSARGLELGRAGALRATPSGGGRPLGPAVLGGVRQRGGVLEDETLMNPRQSAVQLLYAREIPGVQRLEGLQPQPVALPFRAQRNHERVSLDGKACRAIHERD